MLRLPACGLDRQRGRRNRRRRAGATGTSSAADVAPGLQQMVTVAADVATKTATDAAAGKTAAEGLEQHWAPIEDTVKANDPDAYVEIEDAMAAARER